MSSIDITKIKYNWQGTYSATTDYVAKDMVYYNGSSYVALQSVAGVSPDTLGANWAYLASGTVPLNSGFVDMMLAASPSSPTSLTYTEPGRRVLKLSKTNGSAGFNKVIFLMANGTVKATGISSNNVNGSSTDTYHPNTIGIADTTNSVVITDIYEGSYESFALDTNGNVWAWGYNGYGHLGLGDTTNRMLMTKITYFSNNNIKIAKVIPADSSTNNGANGRSTFFLTTTGLLYACGYNGFGNLGDGTTTQRTTPVLVSGLQDVISVGLTCYPSSAFAITSSGNLYTWGYNATGQLGTGDTATKNTPNLVLTGVSQASICYSQSTANSGDYGYTMALKTDGTIWGTGYNSYGALGLGDTTQRLNFQQVTSGVTGVVFTSILARDAAYAITAAIDSNKNLWIWGYNGYGQLGNGTTSTVTTPYLPSGTFQGSVINVKIASFKTYTSVYVQTSNNEIWVTGCNVYGNLALGSTDGSAHPTFTKMNGIYGTILDYNVYGADGNITTVYVLLTNGKVLACGANQNGETGTRQGTGTQTTFAEVFF